MTKKIEFKTEKRKISELKGCDYNPRQLTKKQYSDLKKSIIKFNYAEIALINTDNTIVAGHQRLKILEEIKGADYVVDVRVPNREFTKEEFDEYLIRSNKNTGEWDWDMLANNFEMDNLKEWGFEDSEFGFGFDEETEGDDDVPEQPKESITLKGDLYELGEHRLLCGDSTVITDVEKLMNGENPYLMITDPPYGVEYDPNWRNEVARNSEGMGNRALGAGAVGKVKNDDNADWTAAWSISPSKVAYVYHAGKFSGIVQKSLEDCSYIVRNQIIWAKSNFAISRGDYHWKHEPCWYVVKKGFKAQYIGDRSQTTLWEINKPMKSETGHGTQKPLECMEKPIRNHEGDVYDPFLGSGSTLIACEKTNRKCYGMELDEKYCDVIVKRYIDFCMTNNRPFSFKRNGKDIGEFKKL